MGKCVSDEVSGSYFGDADIDTSLYVMRITLVSSLVTGQFP